MMTLESLINVELSKLSIPKEYQKVEYFITDDKKSLRFIEYILNDVIQENAEIQQLHKVSEARARHSAITFLFGLVLGRYMPLFSKISTLLTPKKKYDLSVELWLLVSLYHDVGYFSEYLRHDKLVYNKVFKYDPLSDAYEGMLGCLLGFEEQRDDVLAYLYQEILQYDIAARDYHINDSNERIDHGILGGYIAFNKMIGKIKSGDKRHEDIIKAKMCALTIAQHNMFKSYSEKDDAVFPGKPEKLTAASNFKITSQTPLLLFLSLVDTIECVKKMSKSNNEDAYMETLTVLRLIKIDESNDWITIDYSDVERQIVKKNSNELHNTYKNYIESVKQLPRWTGLKVENDNDNIIMIKCA